MSLLALMAISLVANSAAQKRAAIPIEPLTSQVYEATGDRAAIARRGTKCMAQMLKPGVRTAPTILTSDPESGVVVANNSLQYAEKLLIPLVYDARSKVSLEARDGRFRLTHTEIEVLTPHGGWAPAKVWSDKLETDALRTSLVKISADLADCIKKPDEQW